jgi:hypothetical protein
MMEPSAETSSTPDGVRRAEESVLAIGNPTLDGLLGCKTA